MSVVAEANSGGLKRAQFYKGIAELALLSLLKDGPQYGLEILEKIRSIAGLSLAEGTIYPLLYRLETAKLTQSKWRLDRGSIRPRKYYELTKKGTAELNLLVQEWRELSSNLNIFLNRK